MVKCLFSIIVLFGGKVLNCGNSVTVTPVRSQKFQGSPICMDVTLETPVVR